MGLLARLTHFLPHVASCVLHVPPRLVEMFRPAPLHLPKVIDNPSNRRQSSDAENSGSQESGDGESDGDDGGDYDGAEEEEERSGDSGAEEGSGEDESGEAEKDAAHGEECDDGEYLGGGGSIFMKLAFYGAMLVLLRHGYGGLRLGRCGEKRRECRRDEVEP